MTGRLRAILSQRVAGVPVAVLFVVLVAVVVIVIRRRRARAAANPGADNPVDTAALDTSTPVGAMSSGGYPGAGYAVPQPFDAAASVDNTGNVTAGMYNPDAGGTTVTGEPVGTASTPAALTPPKVSPAKAAHKAGHAKPVKPAPKAVHKAAAPKKKTTVHKATPAPKPARKPAPRKPTPHEPAHHPKPARKPVRRRPGGRLMAE